MALQPFAFIDDVVRARSAETHERNDRMVIAALEMCFQTGHVLCSFVSAWRRATVSHFIIFFDWTGKETVILLTSRSMDSARYTWIQTTHGRGRGAVRSAKPLPLSATKIGARILTR
jgi:hypothetical protein